MRITVLMTMLAAPLALAACDSGQDGAETEDSTMAEGTMAEDMPMTGETPMAQPGEAGRTASGEGTVTAIDAEGGTITIDHGAIEAVNWPAMTMAFAAEEAELQSFAVGDEFTFDIRTTEGGGEITSISKQ